MKVIHTFDEITTARILVGNAVSEAEKLFEALIQEGRQLANEEERDFVLAILNETRGVEVFAHIFGINKSGGMPAIIDLAEAHDLRNHIAYTTNAALTILNADPSAWQTQEMVGILRAGHELIQAPEDALRRIQSLLRQMKSTIITSFNDKRMQAAHDLTIRCVRFADRGVIPTISNPILMQAATQGIYSLPLSTLSQLASNNGQLRQLADLVYSMNEGSGDTRHSSWDETMLNLMK